MIKKKVLFILLSLLVLPIFVYAAPPTVDFNFTPINPLAFEQIIFDPGISSTTDLNILFWGFSTDGNINYSTQNQSLTLFSDNFNDLSITDWDVNAGIWDASGGFLDGASTDGGGISHTVSDMNLDGNSTIRIYYKDKPTASSIQGIFTWFTNQNGIFPGTSLSNVSGYQLDMQSGGVSVRKVTNGAVTTILTGSGVSIGNYHDVNITHKFDGNIEVWIDGSSIGSVIDTDYNKGSRIIYGLENGITNHNWDDIIISKSGTISINKDKNETFTFNIPGTKKVCLTAGNVDGNTTTCKDVNVMGSVSFTVYDENTNLQILTAKAEINGQIFNSDSNGQINIGSIVTPGDYIIKVYDANYPARYFDFHLDINQSVPKSIYLLDSTKGRQIPFLIRDDNSTKYPNSIFRIMKNGKYVSQVPTDSSSRTMEIFLANLTTDYNFFVDTNTTENNIFSYNNTTVVVSLPKNEETQELITPWGITVTDLTSIDQNGITGSFTFQIYPNTWHPYMITVDANNLDYFERFYHIRGLGGETTLLLQPYMLRPQDNALSASMVLQNSLIGQKIPYYVFKFHTDVGQQANVLVESPQTDSAGKFIFSSVTGKNYFFEIFDEDGDLVNTGSFINNSATEYLTDIFFGSITALFPSNGIIDVNIIQPSNSFIYLNDRNNFGFVYSVNSTGPTFSQVNTTITINDLVVFSENNSPSFPETTFSSAQVFDANFTTNEDYVTAEIQITIISSSGVITRYYKYPLRQILNPFTLNPSLSSLRTSLGDFGAALLWLFIAILISIGLRFNPSFGVDNNAMVFVLMVWTGIAAFIGLIDIIIAFTGIFGGIGYWVLQRRPLG